jgi:UDP-glucose 4-epimerase
VPYEQAYGKGFEDMRRRVPDVSKLARVTGFRPRRDIVTIVRDVVGSMAESLSVAAASTVERAQVA